MITRIPIGCLLNSKAKYMSVWDTSLNPEVSLSSNCYNFWLFEVIVIILIQLILIIFSWQCSRTLIQILKMSQQWALVPMGHAGLNSYELLVSTFFHCSRHNLAFLLLLKTPDNVHCCFITTELTTLNLIINQVYLIHIFSTRCISRSLSQENQTELQPFARREQRGWQAFR